MLGSQRGIPDIHWFYISSLNCMSCATNSLLETLQKMVKGFCEISEKKKKEKSFVSYFWLNWHLPPLQRSQNDHKYVQITVTCKAHKAKSSGTIKQLSDQLVNQVSSLQTLLNGVSLSSSDSPPEKPSGHDRRDQERLPLSPAFPNGPFSRDGDAEGSRTRPMTRGRPGCLEERGWVY